MLEGRLGGVPIKYPVGLSGNLDRHGYAERALAQIGFGYAELGPVTPENRSAGLRIERDAERETLIYSDAGANDGVREIEKRLDRSRSKLPRFIRLLASNAASPSEAGEEYGTLAERLSPYASGWFVELPASCWLRSDEELAGLCEEIYRQVKNVRADLPVLLCVPLDIGEYKLETLLGALKNEAWSGIVIDDVIRTERGFEMGPEGKEVAIRLMEKLRLRLMADQTIVCKAGVHEPQDALDLMRAGADFVQLHSGLVYSGPGLPKRVNEAVLYERMQESPSERSEAMPSFWQSWGWM
nr:hypothetical protein [Cohnella thailandensis]